MAGHLEQEKVEDVMKKRYVSAVILVLACAFCLGAATADRLKFRTLGFSIDPLEVAPGTGGYHSLTMFLPASDGFAPNVGVQIQPYAGTIDEYWALSKKQFEAAKLKLVKESKVGDSSVAIEYSGQLQGRELHWYAKATSSGKKVYLVTATAKESQWKASGARLKACVDSFALNEAAKALPVTPAK